MRSITSVLLLSTLLSSSATAQSANTQTPHKHWDILSLDGGGIRGLITATVVDYMERYAYNYSREAYCLPERQSGRVSMAELFDLVAGTSTGSILATTLVLPNMDPETNST